MENNVVELVFILDESGSMSDLAEDTVGGVNGMYESYKKRDETILVSTVLFAYRTKIVHDRVNLKELPPMTEEDYMPCGGTALYDAVGETITRLQLQRQMMHRKDIPDKTVIAIMTDGWENASFKYSGRRIKKMIEDAKEEGWEFFFMAANIDVQRAAADIGIGADRAMGFIADRANMKLSFNNFSYTLSEMLDKLQ